MDKERQSTQSNFLLKSLAKNREGQVTIFVIIGLIIIVGVAIFFIWIRPDLNIQGGRVEGFEGCVIDAAQQSLQKLEKTAGFLDSEFFYTYKGDPFPYLCYTNLFYSTCVVQKPFLKQHFEENLKKSLRDEIDLCYDSSLQDLKARGYDVTSGTPTYNVVLDPGILRIEVDAPTTIGQSQFKRFNIQIPSPAYGMIGIATTIVQFETVYGDSEISSLMLLYPDYTIDKLKQGDGTTIYFITHKGLKDEIRFASRSLVFPPGYGNV